MISNRLFVNGNLSSLIIFAIILRWSVSLHPHSGEKTPPMYGDYEAQRHWMEITVNLPVEEWYSNTSNNDLMYWGLDYPPLTAYHSYINGRISNFLDPAFVKLKTSRGFESYNHKFFMRSTVIVSDVALYFTSVVLYYCFLFGKNRNCLERFSEVPVDKCKKQEPFKSSQIHVSYLTEIAITLIYPGLVLIDHGHFQYNCVSLGITIAAIAALHIDQLVLSSIAFSLALNYKQMSLYHSLPFFVYMLSQCWPNKTQSVFQGIKKLIKISLTVLITFGIIWLPFLKDSNVCFQVLHRLFPLARGIFEDKVSNVWCAINVVFKLNQLESQFLLLRLCTCCVLLLSLPSLIHLFRHSSHNNFVLSLINVSLTFFLFSYQVHEKSILLVTLPVLLHFPFDPLPCFWFLLISNFSMLPLFIKDQLILPFTAVTLLFSLFVLANVNFPSSHSKSDSLFCRYIPESMCSVLTAFKISILGCVILFFCSVIIKPPKPYPDLWPLLVSVYSCFHFCGFLLYYNYVQIFSTKLKVN